MVLTSSLLMVLVVIEVASQRSSATSGDSSLLDAAKPMYNFLAVTGETSAFAPRMHGPMMQQQGAKDTRPTRRGMLQGVGLGAVPLFLGRIARPANAQLFVESDGSEFAPAVKDVLDLPGPRVLVPVLQAQAQLGNIAELIQDSELDSWRRASVALSKKPFTPTKELKRLFNAYTDNLYVPDASRDSIYGVASRQIDALGLGKPTNGLGVLGVGSGGASPDSKDTLTYLYRNEVLNNVDALAAELAYLINQADAGVEESTDDLFMYLQRAQENFDMYLSNIRKKDLSKARSYLSAAPRDK